MLICGTKNQLYEVAFKKARDIRFSKNKNVIYMPDNKCDARFYFVLSKIIFFEIFKDECFKFYSIAKLKNKTKTNAIEREIIDFCVTNDENFIGYINALSLIIRATFPPNSKLKLKEFYIYNTKALRLDINELFAYNQDIFEDLTTKIVNILKQK